MSSIQVGFNNVSRIKLVLRVANANSTHAKKRLLLNAVASLYQSVSARVAREGSEVEQLTRGHLVDIAISSFSTPRLSQRMRMSF